MSPECRELHSLLTAIYTDPRDMDTRAIYADWLEEHDEPELAAEQRNFSLEKYDAEQYLREFCRSHDSYDMSEIDWEVMLKGLVKGEYCFGSDEGPHLAKEDSRLWEAVRILSGKDLPDSHFENGSFRCAC